MEQPLEKFISENIRREIETARNRCLQSYRFAILFGTGATDIGDSFKAVRLFGLLGGRYSELMKQEAKAAQKIKNILKKEVL